MVTWMPRQLDFDGFFPSAERGLEAEPPDEDEKYLAGVLASLAILQELPFQYLMPWGPALPPDGVRFFHLDDHWIQVLMDGAMSLGRDLDIDYVHDANFIRRVYEEAMAGRAEIRPRLLGREPEPVRRRALEKNSPVTGFLLRSPLVRGWRGLELKVFDRRKEELKALRLETLSEDVLLGLYQGEIAALEIIEPPESFHFGFNRNHTSGQLSKRLRDPRSGVLDESDQAELSLETRPGGHRVIDVRQLAKSLAAALGRKDIDSAHLALEMIQNSHLARISIGEKP